MYKVPIQSLPVLSILVFWLAGTSFGYVPGAIVMFACATPVHGGACHPIDLLRWFMGDIKLVEIFDEPIGLETLRGMKKLEKMELLRKGSRLSVQPVRKNEFEAIRKYAHSK